MLGKIARVARKDLMSQLEIPIPTTEKIIQANAYEARMHFLKPNGSPFGGYQTLPGMVSTPTAEAAQAELPYGGHPGFLMWVDFTELKHTGTVETPRGERYMTARHKVIGALAVATYPGELRPYEEALGEAPNSFVRLWLGRYAMDTSRNSFGEHRHPGMGAQNHDPQLYKRLGITEDLTAIDQRAKRENWDSRVDKRIWYVASLARRAQKDFPELFDGETSWAKRMQIPLRHKSLPPLTKPSGNNVIDLANYQKSHGTSKQNQESAV